MSGQEAGSPTRPTLLLVHGAWHGAWVWEKVRRELTARGCLVHTLDLPSVGERGRPRKALYDDAAAVRQRVEEIRGPVVVVAHSYGGAAVTQGVANLSNVRHIVYVCAFALDVGDSLLGLVGTQPDWWIIDGDIMIPDDPRAVFYHDVEPQEAEWAIGHLRPISYVTVTQALTAAAWRDIASTYIICDRDVAMGAGQDLLAKRATHIRHLPSSHSPMLSLPSELTDLIVEASNQP